MIQYLIFGGVVLIVLIFSCLSISFLVTNIKKHRRRKEYHQLIQKKMRILAELSERPKPPLSPRLLDNVFKQNFGWGETK